MARKRKFTPEQNAELRNALWNAADSTPPQVADTFEARATYERESLSLQILYAVRDHMDRCNIDQQSLAKQLGISEGRVSQILSGDQNLTLRTLASVAAGLRGHFEIRFVPTVGSSTWVQPDQLPLPDLAPQPADQAASKDKEAASSAAQQRTLVRH